jgi:hypothetical protein
MPHVMRFGLAVRDFESPLCLRSTTMGGSGAVNRGSYTVQSLLAVHQR